MTNDTTMVSIRVSPETKQKIKDIVYKKNEKIKALIERLINEEHKKLK